MNAQDFLTTAFEFVAIVPLTLLIIDFILNKAPQQGQQDGQNSVQVLEEGVEEVPLAPRFDTFPKAPETHGWSVVEPTSEWHGLDCPLQVTTAYWQRADELLSKSIRQLKAEASQRHIKAQC